MTTMTVGEERLQTKEIRERLKNLPGWSRKRGALVRVFEFGSYLDGLEFVNHLGEDAEAVDHHPRILLDYKKVTVTYSTHSAHGITELDFRAAERAEELSKGR